MYVVFIPAQGVGQYVHRLVERDVPEIQKINFYEKTLHGFKDNQDALDCKKKGKWSKYSLEYFDPDKEDIKAEDPSGIIRQLKE